MSDIDKALDAAEQTETEEGLRRQILATKKKLLDRTRELSTARKLEAEALAETERLAAALTLYTNVYTTIPDWTAPAKPAGGNRGTLLSFLSDVHAGERVDPSEMEEGNAYDLEVCDLRLKRFFEKQIMLSRNYLTGVEYDGAVLALGGDLVSGDIHDELEQTNLLSTYETVEWLVPRIAAGISSLVEEYGKVHVVSAPGNHGRDSKIPRHKGRSKHNADTHIARLVAVLLAGVDGLTFDIPNSLDVRFTIYESRFTMEHGDAFRFAGTSEIGAIGPVKRGTLRKSRQAQLEGHPFDYSLVGHFHQLVPAYTQGFVMNGSLKGYDEYARSWKFSPEPAQQALLVVTPEHGITQVAPIIVQSRAQEGW